MKMRIVIALCLLLLMASGVFAAPSKLSTAKLTTKMVSPYNKVEATPIVVPQCNDGIDNDGDGDIDTGIDAKKNILVPADGRTYDYAMHYNKFWYDISARRSGTSWARLNINGEDTGWLRVGRSTTLSDGTVVTLRYVKDYRSPQVGLKLEFHADADDGCESSTDDDETDPIALPSCMTDQYAIAVGQSMMEAYSHTFDEDESDCLFGVESFSTPYGSTDDEKTLNLNVEDMRAYRSEYLREGFDDDDVFGTYLYFRDGNRVLRYLNLYYDDIISSVAADGTLTDMTGMIFPIGSSDYTVAKARYDSERDGVEMSLLKRATPITIEEGESISVVHESLDSTETISVTNLIVSDATGVLATNLNIDGEVTGAIAEGEKTVLSDGKVAYIRSITAGASDSVELYIADYELFIPAWNAPRSIEANDETIEDASIDIVGHESGGAYYLSNTLYEYYADGVSGDEPYVAADACLGDYVDEPIGLWAVGVDICHGMVGADHTFFIEEKEIARI